MVLIEARTSSAGDSRRRTKSEVRCREILRAALSCFTELGYERATLAEIRRRSAASTGSIYHHFESKAQLAAALYLEGISDYQAGFLGELEQHTGARAGIVAVVRFHLGWVEAHPDWAQYLFRMRHAEFMGPVEASLRQRNRELVSRLGTWLEPHLRHRRLRRLPAELFMAILLGPTQEFARIWLAARLSNALSAAARILGEAAWLSLREEPLPRGRNRRVA